MNSDRKKLLSLEAEEKFVFHGSPRLLKELSPKQPMIFDERSGKEKKHGNPCVAATPFAEIAIFRAIINPENFPITNYGSSFGINDQGSKEFAVTQEVFEELKKGKTGYVHVFPKDNFSKFSEMEYRSGNSVKPLHIISVSGESLPKDIKPYKGSGTQ